MASTSTNGHDKTYDFTPVDYDASTVPPRIGAGRYNAEASANIKGTKKDNLPMLIVEWTAESVADGNEENEQFVGASISDYLVLSDDPKFRGHKLRLRTMLERMDLSYDIVPRRIENKGDVEELLAAVSGRKLDIAVVHSTDKNGENRENVEYRVAKGGEDAPDREMETNEPRRGASAGKGKPAGKGKSARR